MPKPPFNILELDPLDSFNTEFILFANEKLSDQATIAPPIPLATFSVPPSPSSHNLDPFPIDR